MYQALVRHFELFHTLPQLLQLYFKYFITAEQCIVLLRRSDRRERAAT